MAKRHSIHTGYLGHLESPDTLNEKVCEILQFLRDDPRDFDAIVVTGLSGMVLGSIIAHQLGKQLTIVRKKPREESSHASYIVEGLLTRDHKFIILDDLICTGRTRDRIMQEMRDASNDFACKVTAKPVDMLLYRENGDDGGCMWKRLKSDTDTD